MSGRRLSHSILVPVVHSIKWRSASTILNSTRRSSTFTLSPYLTDFHMSYSTPSTSSSSYNAVTYAQETRLKDLIHTLANHKSPSDVWGGYTNLLSIAGSDYLPVELHQQVLRRCTPSTEELREAIVRRLRAGNIPDVPHIHEVRFQTVIQNIRSLGIQPALDDYNFILEQFAAVGHYHGCYQVYKELMRVGHVPSSQTFRLCFQSIARCYSFPIPKDKREGIVSQTQDLFARYMADLRKHKVAMDAAAFDFALRVLKETLDREAFEALMRWGYGIDLSHPDRVALEYADPATAREGDVPLVPFPFTTTALNTTIDMLGRLGDVSKLVQAFEVLTQPLPHANQFFFNSFESDEDDDFGVKVNVASSRFPPPHAMPNTTTYVLLLRYISRLGHPVFARHYIIQATRLDRSVSFVLRHRVIALLTNSKPIDTLLAPQFAINRAMLLSVLGESNKARNLGLMKWLSTKLPYIIRKQKADLDFYLSVLSGLRRDPDHLPGPSIPEEPPKTPSLISSEEEEDAETLSVAEIPKVKNFDIELHVQTLKRNVFEIENLSQRVQFVLGRTHQRVKERMGRRVWKAKDVYVSSESKRVPMTRQKWKEVVNFQPRKDIYQDHLVSAKPWAPLHRDETNRRMSTIASVSFVGRRSLAPPTPVCRESSNSTASHP